MRFVPVKDMVLRGKDRGYKHMLRRTHNPRNKNKRSP